MINPVGASTAHCVHNIMLPESKTKCDSNKPDRELDYMDNQHSENTPDNCSDYFYIRYYHNDSIYVAKLYG